MDRSQVRVLTLTALVLAVVAVIAMGRQKPARLSQAPEVAGLALVEQCASAARSTHSALASSSMDFAQGALDGAAAKCRDGAARIRAGEAIGGGLNPSAVAAAMETIASGLSEISEGGRLYETAPAAGRAKAQHGAGVYRDGAERLVSATGARG